MNEVGTLWAILLYGWVAGEIVISIVTRTRNSHGKVQDAGTQLMLWAAILFSFSAMNQVRTAQTEMQMSHAGLRLAALIMLAAGLAIRIAAIATLGRSFSANVAIRNAQTIQRKGLYRVVRHPSYLGMEIIFLAVGLHSHNWAALGVIVVVPTLALLYRIHIEEKALLGAFGSDYADYMRTTKRLIPGVY
jgi:protein-S-isoprenylcysteine O-methyltransferase Ste14